MMDITINCSILNAQREKAFIEITTRDIEELVIEKAKNAGYKGYQGRLWTHFDEKIEGVVINE